MSVPTEEQIRAYVDQASAELGVFLGQLAEAQHSGDEQARRDLVAHLDHLALAYRVAETNKAAGGDWRLVDVDIVSLPASTIEEWGTVDGLRLAELAARYIGNPADCRTYIAVVERLVREIVYLEAQARLAAQYGEEGCIG
jgi:hypothetical protein